MSRCALPQDYALARVIERALGDAKAAGLDEIGQRLQAAQAVMSARPDMTTASAVALIIRGVEW